MSDLIDELEEWLARNWDPDLTVAEWWERLGMSGWAAPSLPTNAYGKGLGRTDALAVSDAIAEHGALGAPAGLGMLLAAPTIATYGTPEQIEQFIRPIVTGQRAWCQLFSEPGAGSDLAGLGCRAVRDGDEWMINGQKVWTSGGHYADMGMLIARTNPEVPKHQGITWFAFDMHQGAAVDVRPLREMTGRALFNEVFLSDARVSDAWVIGGTNNGWAVANTTLMFERQGLSAGGQAHTTLASPGTVVGDLPKRAGDFIRDRSPSGGGAGAMVAGSEKLFVELARANGAITSPAVRQKLMKLHTLTEIGRFTNLRVKAERARGRELPGAGNLGKLSMSDVVRTGRDLGLAILGPLGTLHGYTSESRTALDAATGTPVSAYVTEMALFAQAPPIYGGTDQVQKNIIGERVLGLPKEPNNDRITAWSDLPKNT
ncbi:MAG: putative acyl-CoA dehydrogenase [Ilumatobacteraceae bacterium]|nr:putative acyl-CoA dehydrogenase [Ilumatobacteraceae bacterium]